MVIPAWSSVVICGYLRLSMVKEEEIRMPKYLYEEVELMGWWLIDVEG